MIKLLLPLLTAFILGISSQSLDEIDPLKQLDCKKYTIDDDCPNSNVTFWLYTHETRDNPHQLNEADIATIKNARFLPSTRIVVILHGYTGNKTITPNTELRPPYLDLGYNVISVDYGKAAPYPCYLQAVANEPVVARCVARFLNTLLTTPIAAGAIEVEDLHVIGFSLGGQVAGHAGTILQSDYSTKLKWLTALDPASPLYWAMLTKVSQASAAFVDGIHTNAGEFGKLTPIGHVDFYFNGITFQSGCNVFDVLCNHNRSPLFYAETIIPGKYKFCGKSLIPPTEEEMGEYVSHAAKGIYYVTTNSAPPYAKDVTCGSSTTPSNKKKASKAKKYRTKYT